MAGVLQPYGSRMAGVWLVAIPDSTEILLSMVNGPQIVRSVSVRAMWFLESGPWTGSGNHLHIAPRSAARVEPVCRALAFARLVCGPFGTTLQRQGDHPDSYALDQLFSTARLGTTGPSLGPLRLERPCDRSLTAIRVASSSIHCLRRPMAPMREKDRGSVICTPRNEGRTARPLYLKRPRSCLDRPEGIGQEWSAPL